MRFHLFQMIVEITVEIILIIRQGTLSWSIDWCHSKFGVSMECSWDNSLGNWCHSLQAFIDMLWNQKTDQLLPVSDLWQSYTQAPSSYHQTIAIRLALLQWGDVLECQWCQYLRQNNPWIIDESFLVGARSYIICGYNKGFEGRQTTRFRTNSSWCRFKFPLARHGVIRWRPPICLRSFIWFLPLVLVIEFVPDLFSPFWKPCSTGDWPWTAYGVLNRLTRDEKLIFGDMFSTTLLTVEM